MAGLPNPLETVPLDRLRLRTSEKWRHYPGDVLPLWVAEMDVELAEPVIEAIVGAARSGDTGYAVGPAIRRGAGRVRAPPVGLVGLPGGADRTGGRRDGGRRGSAAAGDRPGRHGGREPSGVPAVLRRSVAHAGREVLDAPLGAGGGLDLAVLEEAFRAGDGGRPVRGLPAVQPAEPHRPGALPA